MAAPVTEATGITGTTISQQVVTLRAIALPIHFSLRRWTDLTAAVGLMLATCPVLAAGTCAKFGPDPAVSLSPAELATSLHLTDSAARGVFAPQPRWLPGTDSRGAGFAMTTGAAGGSAVPPCDHAYERTDPFLGGALVLHGRLASNTADPRLQGFDDGGAMRTSLMLTPRTLPLGGLHLEDSWFDAASLFDVSVANANLSKRFQLGGRAALQDGLVRMMGAADRYENVADYGFMLAAGGNRRAFDKTAQKPGVFDRFLDWLQHMRKRLGSVFGDAPSDGLQASAQHAGAAFWLMGLRHDVARDSTQPTLDGSLSEFATGSNIRLTPTLSASAWTSLTSGAVTVPNIAQQSQGALYQAGLTVDFEQGALLLRGRSSYARAEIGSVWPGEAGVRGPDYRLTRIAGDLTAGWSVDLAPIRLQLLSGVRYGEYQGGGLGFQSLWPGGAAGSLHRLDTSLGVSARGTFRAWGRAFEPSLCVDWQHSLSNGNAPMWISFDADQILDYRIARARSTSDSARVKTELSYSPNRSTALFARFSAVVGGPADTQIAAAGVKLHW